MAKGQKEAVVEAVLAVLPNFNKFKDIALIQLTSTQLEVLKTNIGIGIHQGLIEYSKDKENHAEVMSYARSMCMNHLKKAKELNGNVAFAKGTAVAAAPPKSHFPLNKDLLTQELKDYLEKI